MSRQPPTAELEPTGLSTEEAGRRLAEAGANEIQRAKPTSRWRLLARQFASPLIWLLLGAVRGSALLGEARRRHRHRRHRRAERAGRLRAGTPGRARAAGAALDDRAARTRPPRRPRVDDCQPREVVPGDLLLLEAGDVVAADARLLEAHAAVHQRSGADRREPAGREANDARWPRTRRWPNGTTASSWARPSPPARASPRCVATGMRTELGRIAHLLADGEETETPLQRRLARRQPDAALSSASGIVAVVAVARAAARLAALEVFISAVSLAVAAVPEGLPAVVTIALADRRPADGGAPRAHPPAAGGRDAGLRDRHLHRQDRHAHDRRHDGPRAVGTRSPRRCSPRPPPAATPSWARTADAASAIPRSWRSCSRRRERGASTATTSRATQPRVA